MKYLIFPVSKICSNGYFMVTNQSYMSQAFKKNWPLKMLLLSFWVFSFIQCFEQRITDTLSDIVELYK